MKTLISTLLLSAAIASPGTAFAMTALTTTADTTCPSLSVSNTLNQANVDSLVAAMNMAVEDATNGSGIVPVVPTTTIMPTTTIAPAIAPTNTLILSPQSNRSFDVEATYQYVMDMIISEAYAAPFIPIKMELRELLVIGLA